MGSFSGICFELGIGIAIGMLAGTTGTHGSARGRMTLLAGAIGLVVGFLLAGAADLSGLAGALFCAAGGVLGCVVVSDLVAGTIPYRTLRLVRRHVAPWLRVRGKRLKRFVLVWLRAAVRQRLARLRG